MRWFKKKPPACPARPAPPTPPPPPPPGAVERYLTVGGDPLNARTMEMLKLADESRNRMVKLMRDNPGHFGRRVGTDGGGAAKEED